MKRKFAISVVALLLLFSLVAFSACSFLLDFALPHQHTPDTQWHKDASSHWHECSECHKKVENAKHVLSDGVCSVCGWQADEGGSGEGSGNGSDSEQGSQGGETNPGEGGSGSGEGGSGSGEGGSGEGGQGGSGSEGGSGETGTTLLPVEQLTSQYILQHSASDYGYNWLATQTGATELQRVYRAIDAISQQVFTGEASVTSMDVSGTEYYSAGRVESSTLNAKQMRAVYLVYCYDHPYNFWQNQAQVTGGVSGSNPKTYLYVTVLKPFRTHSAVTSTLQQLNVNIRLAYASAYQAANTYEIVADYYSTLALLADYSYSAPGVPSEEYWAHGIVGIFDDDIATGPVCEGYARAFQLLLNLANIDNTYCVGMAADLGAGGGGGHAWNMVQLDDDNWYYFDLTWDDGNDADGGKGGTVEYNYFALSSADTPLGYPFEETHVSATSEDVNNYYYLYDLPTAATQPYGDSTFVIGASWENSDFQFVRNGVNSVAVSIIKTITNTVTIPATVEIEGKTYTVTALGPRFSDGAYTPIVQPTLTRTINLPVTVTSIARAAFNVTNETVTINYQGTQEQWAKVVIGQNAFTCTPIINCQGTAE